MKRIYLVLYFLCMLHAYGQDTGLKSAKPHFFSTNQALHFEGSAGSAFGVQSVNGIGLKSWNLGLGAGLDLYRMRSYPLFLHLRRQVPFTKVPLYFYGDLGRNFVWARRDESLMGNNTKTSHGIFWDAGMQYHVPLRNQTALVISAGYSEKTFSEELTYPVWCITGPCPEVKSVFGYKYRRIVLKAGFQF